MHKHILLFFGICLFVLGACRKKDQRYEGYYVGEEHYTFMDSGATTPSVDCTYVQEIDITYDNAMKARKRLYTFTRKVASSYSEVSQISHESFENNEYLSPLGGYIRFSGDSMYMAFSNWTDAEEVWDIAVWEFKGKRN